MNNETDLDWLARNHHTWPSKADTVVSIGWKCMKVGEPNYVRVNLGKEITKEQWLARRAELQNKPSWADAPEWAEWLAQDKSGAWWFFRRHPKAMSEVWDCDDSAYRHSSWVDGEVLGDWRDTLEKRPEEFQPFTSIEDNQEKDMKQDNRWFERGELPPVGAKVMHKPATDKPEWFEVEVIAHTERYGYKVAVFEYPSAVSYSSATSFRPIRTEREVLMDAIVSQGFLNRDGGVCGQIADAILAAGFSLRDK